MYAHSAPPGINFRNYSLQDGLNAIFKIRFLDKHFIRRHKIHFININYVHFHINYALKVELTQNPAKNLTMFQIPKFNFKKSLVLISILWYPKYIDSK